MAGKWSQWISTIDCMVITVLCLERTYWAQRGQIYSWVRIVVSGRLVSSCCANYAMGCVYRPAACSERVGSSRETLGHIMKTYKLHGSKMLLNMCEETIINGGTSSVPASGRLHRDVVSWVYIGRKGQVCSLGEKSQQRWSREKMCGVHRGLQVRPEHTLAFPLASPGVVSVPFPSFVQWWMETKSPWDESLGCWNGMDGDCVAIWRDSIQCLEVFRMGLLLGNAAGLCVSNLQKFVSHNPWSHF